MAQQDPTTSPSPAPSPGPAPRATFGGHIADPGPLGLAGFAGTTFFLSAVNSGMLAAGVQAGVLGLAIFYGGIAQLLAGMWEFVKGNTFGATAFASFGAFWLSFWWLTTKSHLEGSPHDINHAIGTYLLVWTIFTAYMFIASLRTTAAIAAVFIALAVTFLFLAIGAFKGDAAGHGLTEVGGYVGLVTAILAWYGSFAAVTNSTFDKTVLPVFPLG
jgi:succinate-acetate transporter protein